MHATGLRYLPWHPIAGGNGEGEPPTTPPASTPPTSGDTDGERDERKFTKAELATATADAVRRERERAEAERKKATDAAEAAKLAEQQEYQKLAETHKRKADELEAALAERDAKLAAAQLAHAVEREAAALGFADPADAHRFLDVAAVTRAEDGTPQNVKALLEAVLSAKPYLKGVSTGSTSGVPATPRPSGGALSRDQLIAQTKQELQASGRYSF